jgi:hypothetical protein
LSPNFGLVVDPKSLYRSYRPDSDRDRSKIAVPIVSARQRQGQATQQGCFVAIVEDGYEELTEERIDIPIQALGNGSRSDETLLIERLASILGTRGKLQLPAR